MPAVSPNKTIEGSLGNGSVVAVTVINMIVIVLVAGDMVFCDDLLYHILLVLQVSLRSGRECD